MNLSELIELLGGRYANRDDCHGWAPCPSCGVGVKVWADGVRRLCRLCTEREIGESTDELTARVSRRMSRKAYLALPRDNDGKPILPSLTYRQWRESQR